MPHLGTNLRQIISQLQNLSREQMVHGVETGRFVVEKVGGGEGASGKGFAAVDLMGEGEALVSVVKNEGVFANDFAGTDGVDAGVGEVFCEMDGGAARGVFLLGMMGFNEVDVGGEVLRGEGS